MVIDSQKLDDSGKNGGLRSMFTISIDLVFSIDGSTFVAYKPRGGAVGSSLGS